MDSIPEDKFTPTTPAKKIATPANHERVKNFPNTPTNKDSSLEELALCYNYNSITVSNCHIDICKYLKADEILLKSFKKTKNDILLVKDLL